MELRSNWEAEEPPGVSSVVPQGVTIADKAILGYILNLEMPRGLPRGLLLIEAVNFYQGDAGGVFYSGNNYGVVARFQ